MTRKRVDSQDDRGDELARVFQLHPRVRQVSLREGLWVLSKPAGVLSHPNPPAREAANTVLRVPYDLKREAYVAGESGGERSREAFLAHRLDQDTSGLILLTLRPDLAAKLKEMFYYREVVKEYRALVRGAPKSSQGVWRDHLRKKRARGQLRVEVVRGKEPNAETRYQLVRTFPEFGVSLLTLVPETGRTHQLRVQCAARKHPVAGDERYGDFSWNRELRRRIGLRQMFLHAFRLELRHPETRKRLTFLAEQTGHLEKALGQLRGQAGGK